MANLTAAVNENVFQEIFEVVRDGFAESTSGTKDVGPFVLGWNIGVRLDEGSIDLQSDGTVHIDELDIVYDPLQISLGIDIPEICVGGWCILPTPFGCAIRLPRICLFEDDPDITLDLDLSGLIESEISGAFSIKKRYAVDPTRPVGMTDHDAHDADLANKWQFLLDPDWLDIDLIDISDTVGNILDAAIDNAVDLLLGWLPGWARDLIKAILGAVVDVIRAILDIADDIDEWLSNLLGVSIGLFDFVATVVADYFANQNPIFELPDPFQVQKGEPGLIPVLAPIEDIDCTINDDEFIVTATVGA